MVVFDVNDKTIKQEPILKRYLSLFLCYAGFTLSDWPLKKLQPIRVLQTSAE